ncbi:MAG: transposase [Spirochaetales bacterium]|nr:transposase [Spirochaetales bacterium]
MADIKDLFDAYKEGDLPQEGGYVVSVFFDDTSNYTRFEAISYGNVKDIYVTDEGITFQADGRKLFVLYEPVTYIQKGIDPCYRDDSHRIPYRFNELERHVTKRQDRIYVAKEPVETYTAFTVLNETGYNESYVVYQGEDSGEMVGNFVLMTLWKNMRIARADAQSAVDLLNKVIPVWMKPFGFEDNDDEE